MTPDGEALLRWTGRGSLESLAVSAKEVLGGKGTKLRLEKVGNTLLVGGGNPGAIADQASFIPGVAWTGVGFRLPLRDLAKGTELLARKYLRRGESFDLTAEVSGGQISSDFAGAATSAVLGAVRDVRADGEDPRVTFRVAVDGGRAVVGVMKKRGVGGSTRGRVKVVCLVSGGRHSSVVAWYSLLSGFRVKLVHFKAGAEALGAVADLYAELVGRVGAGGVELEVVGASTPLEGMRRLGPEGPRLFSGFTSANKAPDGLEPQVESPLFLLPEEEFSDAYDGLSLREDAGKGVLEVFGEMEKGPWSYSGEAAGVSEVIDGLTRSVRRS